MRTYNRIFIIGNCAAEPILSETKAGKPYLYFPIAVNKINNSENKEVDFHRIVYWGETANKFKELITKGSRLFVTGKITNHKYETNSETKYITEIHASQIEILTFKETKENTEPNKKKLTTA